MKTCTLTEWHFLTGCKICRWAGIPLLSTSVYGIRWHLASLISFLHCHYWPSYHNHQHDSYDQEVPARGLACNAHRQTFNSCHLRHCPSWSQSTHNDEFILIWWCFDDDLMMIMSSWSQGACFDLLFAIKDREQGVAFVKILAQINIRIYSYINVYKYVFSCGEKHCPPPLLKGHWATTPIALYNNNTHLQACCE